MEEFIQTARAKLEFHRLEAERLKNIIIPRVQMKDPKELEDFIKEGTQLLQSLGLLNE